MTNEKELAYSIKILGTDKQINNIDQLKKAIKEASEVAQKSDFGTDAYRLATDVVNDLKASQFKLNKEITAQQKSWQSLKFPEGSYRQIQSEAAALTESLRTQVKGVTVTSEAYEEMEKKLIGLKSSLADFDRKLSPGGTLVGEYARGIKQAFDELGASNFFDKIEQGVNLGAGAVKGSIASVEGQLKELKDVQKKYTEQGSKEFDLLQDKIEDLAGAARAYKQDLKDAAKLNEGFDQTVGGLAKVGAGFVSAYGALKTFTSGEEDAQKAIAETVKYIQYAQAISELADNQKQASILVNIAYRKLETLQENLNTAAQSKNIVVKYAAIAAQKALNAVMALGPWGVVAAGIGLVVAAYGTYKLLSNEVSEVEKKRAINLKLTTELQKETSKEAGKELATLEKLKTAITDTGASTKLRKDALKQYNETAAEGNKIDATQIDNTKVLESAFKRQTDLIIKRAEARAIENAFAKAFEEVLNQENSLDEARNNLVNDKTSAIGRYGNALKGAFTLVTGGGTDAAKAVAGVAGAYDLAKGKLGEANDTLEFYRKKLIEVQSTSDDLYESKNQAEKKSAEFQKANIDAEIAAAVKAGEIILGIQRKRLEKSLSDLRDGREKEIELRKQSFEDLKSSIVNELNEIDNLLDLNRKKKIEIDKNDKLDPKEKAVLLKELDQLYKQLYKERLDAGQDTNQLLKEAEVQLRSDIKEINRKFNERELLDKLIMLDEESKAEILSADTLRAKVHKIALESIKDKTKLKKEELRIEDEYNEKEYQSRKKALESKRQLLFLEINKPTASTGGGADFETEEAKKKKEALSKIYNEINNELAKLEEARTGKQEEESEKRAQLDKQESDNKIQATNGVFNVVTNILSSTAGVVDEFAQREMSAYDSKINFQKDKLSELESKVSSTSGATQRIYSKQLKAERAELEKTEKEKEGTRRKYAKIKKGIDITQAIIATASSAIQAFSSMAAIPIVGPALGAVAAAAAAAFGAVQVGLISSTPLAKGGNLNGDISNVQDGSIPSGAGVIMGPSHQSKSGGVGFTYKGRPFKAEGGEIKTNNGGERFIFTKSVNSDPLLRSIALATHNSKGHPMARIIGSLVNQYAGGRSFMGGAQMMAMGGSLDAVIGQPLGAPIVVTSQSTDPAILSLISEVNEQNKTFAKKMDERISKIETIKWAVPVDRVTEIQTDETRVRSTALF